MLHIPWGWACIDSDRLASIRTRRTFILNTEWGKKKITAGKGRTAWICSTFHGYGLIALVQTRRQRTKKYWDIHNTKKTKKHDRDGKGQKSMDFLDTAMALRLCGQGAKGQRNTGTFMARKKRKKKAC